MNKQVINIIPKKTMKEKLEQKLLNRLSLNNDYSIKKPSTLIENNPEFKQKLNLLISPNYKSIFNPNSIFKGEKSNISKNKLNDLSNSNALMKTTEENLISGVNEEFIVSKNSKINLTKRKSIVKSESLNNKLSAAGILKNALNFFHRKSINEEEKAKNRSTSKIISNKIFEEIEKEKNKILTQQKKRRNSAYFDGINNNYFNQFINKTKENKKKKKSRPSIFLSEKCSNSNLTNNINNSNINNANKFKPLKRRRFSIFSGRESMQIKSLRDVGLHLSKTISKLNGKGSKKDLEASDVSKIIEKYPTQNKPILKKRQSVENTSNITDFTGLSKEINIENNDAFKTKYEERFRQLFTCNNLYDSLDDDENEDPEKSNIYYIAPNSVSCIIIDSFILIATLISLIYIPYFLAAILTNCKIHFFSSYFFLYLFIELVYVMDLITGCFRAYYNFEEVLIVKKRYMILNYIKGSFFIDLIEAIPFFKILNSGQENCGKEGSFNFAFTDNFKYSLLIIKILKIMKIHKNSALKLIDKFLSKNNFYSDWNSLFINIFFIFASVHLVSCYFIFLGKSVYPNWIAKTGLLSKSFSDIYITALYYVMTTLTTVGYGDIQVHSDRERIFQSFLLIVGTCAYSWLLTYISNYIKKNNEKYKVFEEKLKILEEIKINYPRLNVNLYDRIYRYLNYNKSRYKYDIKYVLESLPSSIQNNLIIEIYKPIIKNFHFFKSLENSDFFVKIVTSMKPILAVKDDVLINEGDVIEEIIFIKKGILSLHIGINLDDTQKFAEDYLSDKNKNLNSTLSNIQTLSQINKANTLFSFITSNTRKVEKKTYRKKLIKVIDLRKNEHFGDALMILNEKSPVTIKVRSKTAELLFLQKTDATEISNVYPNIWKSIVTNSLTNMNQIKNMIKKKIILYCELHDVGINPKIKNKYIENTLTSKKVTFMDEDFKSKSSKKKSKIKSNIKSIILEEDESKFMSLKNSNISSRKKISEFNSNLGRKNLSTNRLKSKLYSSKIDKKNATGIKEKSVIEVNNNNNNNNNNINNIKVNNDNNNININNNSNINNNKMPLIINSNNNKIDTSKIFELIQKNINSILEGKIDTEDKNNKLMKSNNLKKTNIISEKEWKSVEMKKSKNTNSTIKFNSNYSNINDKSFERINEEQYFNEDFDLNILNKHISMNNSDKNNYIFHHREKILETQENSVDSFSPNNNYDKLNKLLSDENITEVNIEKVIIDNKSIKTEERNNKINIYNNIVINNSNKNDDNLEKNFQKNTKFSNLQSFSSGSFTINSTYENINRMSNYTYSSSPILKQKIRKILVPKCFSKLQTIQIPKAAEKSDESIIRGDTINVKYKKLIQSADKAKKPKEKTVIEKHAHFANSNLVSYNTTTFVSNKKNNNIFKKKKGGKKAEKEDELGTFYTRIQEISSGKKISKSKDKNKEHFEFEEQITKNIEKNKLKLNNPDEYFSGLFNNILSKKNVKK